MQSDQEHNETNSNGEAPELEKGSLSQSIHLNDMYQGWFLDYASYVILERAVPEINDGLKPVQRRILHAMKELDDGRYNKVANIIGHTMKYHPHGDASIGDALVQLGQKDLLIDCQGNWGNILTGDSAAAARYIEARLSKFALEVQFNPKTTTWKSSYDGRNKEPVALPSKFPLLLAMGVEGIAVGLASKILPHNFNELIDASIKILQDKEFELFPDFLTGGMIDVSRYNDGLRGGKIRVRARIVQDDKKTLKITEIPFGTTTGSIIDSILVANDKGKIKIRKIDDNTSENVEVLIHLAPGVSPDTTMDALYAFTECEVSISPNSCVIKNGKPGFIGVSDILRHNTSQTVDLLKLELTIKLQELNEQLHYSSLEKIFIENEVYEGIKKCKTDEEIDSAIRKGLKPFAKQIIRQVSDEDVKRLRKIPIERISKFNSNKADEVMKGIRLDMDEVQNHLDHLIDYAIEYYRQIRKKYGKNRDRKTEIRNFEVIEAAKVAAANQKLYVNREEGFAGTGLRKDEYICDCSDIDDIIIFRDDGTFIVTKVAEKVFVGQNVTYINVFQKNDNRTVYNLIYRDGKNGKIMVKRFSVLGVTRDKEYSATKGTAGSKMLYFTANPNGEAEMVKVELKPKPRLKKTFFDFDFASLSIKGRNSIGNTLTKYAVRKIEIRQEGVSTLGSLNIWYDDTVQRLNTEARGLLLGAFAGADRIFTFMQSGAYKLTSFDLSTHFEEEMVLIEKFDPARIFTVIYQEEETKQYYIKRFRIELTEKKVEFVEPGDKMILFTYDRYPQFEILFDMKIKTKGSESEIISVHEFIGVKGVKAKGRKITVYPVKKVEWLEPLQIAEPEISVETDPEGDNSDDSPMQPPIELPGIEDTEPTPLKDKGKRTSARQKAEKALPGLKKKTTTGNNSELKPESGSARKVTDKPSAKKPDKNKTKEEIKGEQMELF
ncbi:MAG: DNA gyrase/topoisomerase IV subunit A [Bacteroidetes bacterium]|nr:DNA gyrase/topoisomerase IV subunit A [Bacteroidota bacterium]